MDIRANIASEINEHHASATAKAGEAIHHAKEAGRLLLEVKAAVPHGEFGKWLEQNITVSVRQAQRYIAVAEGKPIPIRALTSKYDTVSHLPEPTDSERSLTDYIPEPTFLPKPGRWMIATTGDGSFHVVPSLEHPGYFHISKLYTFPLLGSAPEFHIEPYEPDSMYDGTKSPVLAYVVESTLQYMGLAEPSKAAWDMVEHQGMSRPFGEPGPPHIQDMP